MIFFCLFLSIQVFKATATILPNDSTDPSSLRHACFIPGVSQTIAGYLDVPTQANFSRSCRDARARYHLKNPRNQALVLEKAIELVLIPIKQGLNVPLTTVKIYEHALRKGTPESRVNIVYHEGLEKLLTRGIAVNSYRLYQFFVEQLLRYGIRPENAVPFIESVYKNRACYLFSSVLNYFPYNLPQLRGINALKEPALSCFIELTIQKENQILSKWITMLLRTDDEVYRHLLEQLLKMDSHFFMDNEFNLRSFVPYVYSVGFKDLSTSIHIMRRTLHFLLPTRKDEYYLQIGYLREIYDFLSYSRKYMFMKSLLKEVKSKVLNGTESEWGHSLIFFMQISDRVDLLMDLLKFSFQLPSSDRMDHILAQQFMYLFKARIFSIPWTPTTWNEAVNIAVHTILRSQGSAHPANIFSAATKLVSKSQLLAIADVSWQRKNLKLIESVLEEMESRCKGEEQELSAVDIRSFVLNVEQMINNLQPGRNYYPEMIKQIEMRLYRLSHSYRFLIHP